MMKFAASDLEEAMDTMHAVTAMLRVAMDNPQMMTILTEADTFHYMSLLQAVADEVLAKSAEKHYGPDENNSNEPTNTLQS